MICTLFKNLMDLHTEGRLAGFETRWLERHVLSCPECAAELAVWKRLSTELHSLTIPPAPEKLKTMIRTAIAAKQHTDRKPAGDTGESPLLAWTPSMALAFGVLAFALSVSISVLGPGVPSQTCSNGDVSVCFISR